MTALLRCKSHNIKFTLIYNSMNFSTYSHRVCKHHHYLILEHLHPRKESHTHQNNIFLKQYFLLVNENSLFLYIYLVFHNLAELSNQFKSFFCICFWVFSVEITLSVNQFLSSFLIFIYFTYFSCLIALARTSIGHKWYTCIISEFEENCSQWFLVDTYCEFKELSFYFQFFYFLP